MAYNKHNYQDGEILHGSQLNEMDTQIAANEERIVSLKEEITNISESTKNLFDAEIRPYTNIDNNSGSFSEFKDGSANPNTVAIETYIPVKEDTVYIVSYNAEFNKTPAIFFYDSNKSYISNSGTSPRFITPNTCRFVRLKWNKSGSTVEMANTLNKNVQLEEGEIATEFVSPKTAKIADGAVSENKIADGAVSENKIADGAVSENKLTIVERTANIMTEPFAVNFAMDSTTNKPRYSPNATYASTIKPVEVKPNQQYVITKPSYLHGFVYEYDSDDVFVVRTRVDDGSVITTTPNTKYIRLQESYAEMQSIYKNIKYQVEEGSEKTPYVRPLIINKEYIPNVEPSEKSVTLEMLSDDVVKAFGKNITIDAIKMQLDEKRASIIKRNDDKSMNIGFVTDTHLENVNGDQTGLIDIQTINQLASENWLDCVIHGGDIFNSYLEGSVNGSQGITFDMALTRIDDAMSGFCDVKCPLYVARGNHDVNVKYKPNYPTDETVDSTQKITQAQFKMLVQSKFRQSVDGEYGCSFYRDFDDKKIRVIMLDVYIKDNQSPNFTHDSLDWLVNDAMMLNDKKDYSIVITAHTFESSAKTIMANVISAYKNGTVYANASLNVTADFSKQGACDFIGALCGHTHSESETNEDGYWYATSATSYLKDNDNVANNIYANVYTIDMTNKILYKQKLGVGGHNIAMHWNTLEVENI